MIAQCDKLLHDKTMHPLISIGNLSDISPNAVIKTGFYHILLRGRSLQPEFGGLCCDYQDATVIFLPPQYPLSHFMANISDSDKNYTYISFHEKLSNNACTEGAPDNYSFFYYRQEESLHISLREKEILLTRIKDITDELNWGIDRYTYTLITEKIELFLNYCKRFYTRQFITRAETNKRIMQQIHKMADLCFFTDKFPKKEISSTDYFAKKLDMSSAYLEDLLKHETGMSMAEYVQLRRLSIAQKLLCQTDKSVSCIAKELGYPSSGHFSKLFKTIFGYTPDEYRNLN